MTALSQSSAKANTCFQSRLAAHWPEGRTSRLGSEGDAQDSGEGTPRASFARALTGAALARRAPCPAGLARSRPVLGRACVHDGTQRIPDYSPMSHPKRSEI